MMVLSGQHKPEVKNSSFPTTGFPLAKVAVSRIERPAKAPRPTQLPPKETVKEEYPEILMAVQALGLVATADQVATAVHAVFPNGVANIDVGRVIRSVFVHLQRKNRGDNVR